MKKKVITMFMASAVSASLTAPAVMAKTGDVIGDVYSTDILAYVNGLPINSYNIGGRTVVVVEELDNHEGEYLNYGFDWYYNDDTRILTVNSTGMAANGNPNVSRGKSGKITGKVYETDIKVLFNNKELKGYNIGGKTAICIEDLGTYDDSSKNAAYGYSDYLCNFVWDDDKREIALNTYRDAGQFYDYPVKKLEFKLNDNILSASFDQENSYESWLEINMTDEFKADTYRIKDVFYNNKGTMEKVGTMHVEDDERVAWNIDFDMLSQYTEGIATILSYEEATKYVQDNYAVLDKRSYDLGDSYIAQKDGYKYWIITYKKGGYIRTYESPEHISLTFNTDSYEEDCFVVYPYGGPHGATTMATSIKTAMEYYQFD